METKVSSADKEVIIGEGHPTVLIGERINPTGRKRLSDALKAGNLEYVREEAIAQVREGADILDVNVAVTGLDEVALLPEVVKVVQESVDVPLCIDSNEPKAIEKALSIYKGKALINSVNGDDQTLGKVLQMVKECRAAVIGLSMDESGIPNTAEQRLEIARKIVARAEEFGISRRDVIIDSLAMAVGADTKAGRITIETIRMVRNELGVNQTLGASNISFGMPDRRLINRAFLCIIIASGVNCPIVDAAKARPITLAADLALGLDDYASRYISSYRARKDRGSRKRAGEHPIELLKKPLE